MLGAVGVGKTSLVRQFVDSLFTDVYHSTVGVRVDKKRIEVAGKDVALMLWDLHGEGERQPVVDAYLRGLDGYLLVVDATRPETVELATRVHARVLDRIGPRPFALALSKADLMEDWREAEAATAALASEAAVVSRTSARTGAGVEDSFARLAERLVGGGAAPVR